MGDARNQTAQRRNLLSLVQFHLGLCKSRRTLLNKLFKILVGFLELFGKPGVLYSEPDLGSNGAKQTEVLLGESTDFGVVLHIDNAEGPALAEQRRAGYRAEAGIGDAFSMRKSLIGQSIGRNNPPAFIQDSIRYGPGENDRRRFHILFAPCGGDHRDECLLIPVQQA